MIGYYYYARVIGAKRRKRAIDVQHLTTFPTQETKELYGAAMLGLPANTSRRHIPSKRQ